MVIMTSTRLPGDNRQIDRLDLSQSGHAERPVPAIAGMAA